MRTRYRTGNFPSGHFRYCSKQELKSIFPFDSDEKIKKEGRKVDYDPKCNL